MPSGNSERELRKVAESLVLAERMFRKGRITEAEPMYERSLAMLIRTYAEAHPDVDACLMRLGDIYFAREKFAQALSTYSRLHGLRSRTLSIHHADTVAVLFKVAKCQERLEHFDDAAKTYEEAISLGEQWLQPGLPLIGSMMESYAILLRKYLNKPQQAAEIEQRAKDYRKKSSGRPGLMSKMPSVSNRQSLPFAPAELPGSNSFSNSPPSVPTEQRQSVLPNLVQTDRPSTLIEPETRITPNLGSADAGVVDGKINPELVGDAAANEGSTRDAEKENSDGDSEYEDDEYDDDDSDYDEEDYTDGKKRSSKNYLLVAFVVLVAVIVPTFVGWIVMTRNVNIEWVMPFGQPTSSGATTMSGTTSPATTTSESTMPATTTSESTMPAMTTSESTMPATSTPATQDVARPDAQYVAPQSTPDAYSQDVGTTDRRAQPVAP